MAVIYALANRETVLRALHDAGMPPAFACIVADHVTYLDGGDGGRPPAVGAARAIGYARGDGVDALVVEVDGVLWRPDSKVFHVTLSLAAGHEAGEAGDVAAAALGDGTLAPVSGMDLDLRPAQ